MGNLVCCVYPNREDAEEKKKKNQNQKKKKKKGLMNRDDSVSVTSRNNSIVAIAALNDDMLACQILCRLLAKSLMRFKCVCKDWKSIIEQDSNFIGLQRAHSESRPRLSVSAIVGRELLLLSADLQQDSVSSIQSVKRIQLPSTVADPKDVEIVGPVVGGMLCFFDRAGVSVQMCNVSTGEVTPWIKSTADENVKSGFVLECYFGFDPPTGKHKAINVWGEWDFSSNKLILGECEVLSAGESRWRVIDDVPQFNPYESTYVSGYANGSIYWCMSERLIAFDVGSEKFRTIGVPNRWASDRRLCWGGLIEMDGRPTLIRRGISRDHEVKIEEEEDCWNSEEVGIITLPFDCFDSMMDTHHIPGRDQMVMIQSQVRKKYFPSRRLKMKFDCYDVRSKSLSRFEIDGIPSSVQLDDCAATKCSAFVENLCPLLPRS